MDLNLNLSSEYINLFMFQAVNILCLLWVKFMLIIPLIGKKFKKFKRLTDNVEV